MGAVKFKKGFAYTKGNKNVVDLEQALIIEAQDNCCGVDCCEGMLVLPNWVTGTGRVDGWAAAIIDGAWVIDTSTNVLAAIAATKP